MPNRNVRSLRKTMTDAERRLWSALRGRRLGNYKFRRQHPAGPYILDFACLEYHVAGLVSNTMWRAKPTADNTPTTKPTGGGQLG